MLRFLLHHPVFPAKYFSAIFEFLELGIDKNHEHFLVQSVPVYSVTEEGIIIKSMAARGIFRRAPQANQE